jgi:hypothetical protein
MGLESDARAGGIRVGDIVAKPGDLSRNVDKMAAMFRQGQITANDIHERFGSRGIAEDRAAVAKAGLATKQVEELGDIQIAAQKSQLSPEITGLKAQATVGSLEEQIANQSVAKEMREPRNQLLKAQVAQAIAQAQGNLTAPMVQQLQLQYPGLIKAQYDENGVVLNKEEVVKQIGRVKVQQQWIDSVQDMAKNIRFVTVKEELSDGQIRETEKAFWSGTQTPVPQAQLAAIAAAQAANPGTVQDPQFASKLAAAFGKPGQVSTATGATAVDPNAPAPLPGEAPAAAPAPGPGVLPPPGQPIQVRVAGEAAPGGIVTSMGKPAGGKPTDVEARAFKFAKRMELSEGQYQKVIASGVDPTTFAMNFQTGLLEQVPSMKSGIPVLGPLAGTYVESKVSPDAKRLSSAMGNWASAILREESGAAIKDEERAQYIRAFFPITGDPPDVRANKAAQRKSAGEALQAVFARKITPAEYENQIANLAGLDFFPKATSVHTEGSPENKAWANAGGPGMTVGVAAPDNVPTLEAGQLPPPDAGFVRSNGKLYRRRTAKPVK